MKVATEQHAAFVAQYGPADFWKGYEATRPPFADAGPWDRTVRGTRAAEKLRARGAKQIDLRVEERAGVAMLVDVTDPNRIEAL